MSQIALAAGRGTPRELRALADVVRAADADPLLVWAAQGLRPGVRAWALGDAVAVASADLSCRNRLAVRGRASSVATLVLQALGEVGPTYRPIGDEDLVAGLTGRIAALELVDRFGWMDATCRAPATAEGAGARWLRPEELDDVTALLAAAFPSSYARPGVPGVRRWAGVHDGEGRLLATAADAWTAPGVGFVAGVATDERARGRGLATAACRLVLDTLVAEQGRAALIVDGWNMPAILVYERLGLRFRALAAARVATPASAW